MTEKLKLYEGIYWEQDDLNFIGVRFELWATDPFDAHAKFVETYGEGKMFSLNNEEEANKPR